MISRKLSEKLNEQINKEIYSAYLYQDISNYYAGVKGEDWTSTITVNGTGNAIL